MFNPACASERILVALDVPELNSALGLVKDLKEHVGGFKVGLELCTACGIRPVVSEVASAGGKLFLDLKFKDIPNTVAGAVRGACLPGVFMLNVHCDGGSAMMKAAAEAAKQSEHKPLLIGVTVLTSIDADTLKNELGVGRDPATQVVELAKLAREAGLDGVVCSPQEVEQVKKACGSDFLTVVPGVRPNWAAAGDQKRLATPAATLAAGADYLVIGRPITNPPAEIGSRQQAAIAIGNEMNDWTRTAKCK